MLIVAVCTYFKLFSLFLRVVRFAGALDSTAVTMPDKMLATYNEFVDKIYARINKVLKDSYDPVNVSLNHEGAEVKSSGSKKSNKK